MLYYSSTISLVWQPPDWTGLYHGSTRMPKKDGLQVVTELMSSRRPEPRIIVMTTYEDEADVRRALKAGAKAHLVKGTDAQQFREAVRKVAASDR